MRRGMGFVWLALLLAGLGATDRPRDPWVFRCVLDKHPRMVVIALHEHLWVAYDATDCTLYKAWDGDVKFTGAVYDYVHGPQPQVRGETWMAGEPDERPLFLSGPNGATALPRWAGYRFSDDHVWLQFEFRMGDGSMVTVSESPEVQSDPDGRTIFRRTLVVEGLTDDWVVRVPVDHRDAAGHSIQYLEDALYRAEAIMTPSGDMAAAMDFAAITTNGQTTISALMPGGGG